VRPRLCSGRETRAGFASTADGCEIAAGAVAVGAGTGWLAGAGEAEDEPLAFG
jgi:hypothetical protein